MSKQNKFTKSGGKLITAADTVDVLDGFSSDAERLKYMKKAYANMSITEAFATFYNLDLSGVDKSQRKQINTVTTIELGNCYWGTVMSITKGGITFSINGVKEEIVSKENFSDCIDNIQNYLLNHDNKLYFKVRDKVNGHYVVSVIEGYYNLWLDKINQAIERDEVINVHIDELTKGGYLCHTNIDTINELTGKLYTSSVFIPGSNIVLNIERNFERWIGQEVQAIPQKMVKFKNIGDMVENSLIASRKKVLMIQGFNNIFEIYQRHNLGQKANNFKPEVFDGTITGIINSNKKTGAFVELNGKYITGLLPLDPSELLDFKPGDTVKVSVDKFEVQEGKEPFEMKHGKMRKCNTRFIFKLA